MNEEISNSLRVYGLLFSHDTNKLQASEKKKKKQKCVHLQNQMQTFTLVQKNHLIATVWKFLNFNWQPDDDLRDFLWFWYAALIRNWWRVKSSTHLLHRRAQFYVIFFYLHLIAIVIILNWNPIKNNKRITSCATAQFHLICPYSNQMQFTLIKRCTNYQFSTTV